MNKSFLVKLRNKYGAMVHDIMWVPISLGAAYWVRYDLTLGVSEWESSYLTVLFVALPVQILLNQLTGLYRGIWRFASVPDLVRIIKSVGTGVVVSLIILFLFNRLEGIPRSVILLYPLFLVMSLSFPRLLYRWIKDRNMHLRSGKRVLILGAGNAAEMLLRDLQRDPDRTFEPVALIDDDPNQKGREIRGIKVVGESNDIARISQLLEIELIMIATPSANAAEMRNMVENCEASGIEYRTLPGMNDLVAGRVSLNELREVTIEDILGRDPVTMDWGAIQNSINNKIVLVSGGGGSIGSELCRQIARLAPRKLIVIDHSEFNLFEIDKELRHRFPDIDISSVLCSVQDRSKLDQLFSTEKPNVVFHAAAYKHVPLLEHQARAAATNNVLGTKILADVSNKYNCESFVMISTDKAVNPTNTMGTTKRVAEIYCQSLNKESNTKFITVRFGNVLGSAGSVIPIFKEQIAKGGPVTVTHADIERYFMTIPEASQLIMQAGSMGVGGEIFVLDMGEPVKISYLAEQMITLSGKEPGKDIEITYTGLRPGEKMYEELFHSKESMERTEHPKITKAKSRMVNPEEIAAVFASIKQACDDNDDAKILENLVKLVPERESSQGMPTSENKVVPIRRG